MKVLEVFIKMFNKKFLKNLFGFSMINWIAFIIGFVSTLILTRVYNPSELGAISIFISLTSVYQVTVSMGQDQFIVRKYYEQENKEKLISTILILELISWIILMIITIFLSSFLSKLILGEINIFAVIATSVISLPLSLFRLITQISKLENAIFEHGKQILIFNLVSRIIVIGIGFINKDYNLYILCYSIVVFVISMLFFIKEIKKIKTNNHSKEKISCLDLKIAMNYGLPLMMASVMFMIKDLLPRVILREEGTLHDVGILGAAMTLASSINVVISGFNTYFSAYFFENYEEDKGQINVIHHMLVFVLVESLIILSLFSGIISLLVGESFRDAGSIFPIIAMFSISQVISETTVHGINVKEKTYLHIIITLIALIAIYTCSILLVNKYGVLGISVSYSVGGLVFYFLRTILGQKNYRNINKIGVTHVVLVITFLVSIFNHIYFNNYLLRFSVLIITGIIIALIYKQYINKFLKLLKILLQKKREKSDDN